MDLRQPKCHSFEHRRGSNEWEKNRWTSLVKLDFSSERYTRLHTYLFVDSLFSLSSLFPNPRHNLPTLENRTHAIIKRVSVYVSRILSVFFIAATFICCLLISSARAATANSIPPRAHTYIHRGGYWFSPCARNTSNRPLGFLFSFLSSRFFLPFPFLLLRGFVTAIDFERIPRVICRISIHAASNCNSESGEMNTGFHDNRWRKKTASSRCSR